MRASQYFLPTLREVPAEAELVSHRLLLRGGFIRKLAAGVYSFLPLGWRVHQKIAAIVREEMDAIGGQEVFLPALVPRELLDSTSRSGIDILFSLRDRNRRDFFLGFTHEEVVTDIVQESVRSWKQLPLILYQIQTKFRDEARPRGGLIRVREFTMKDSYSFDCDEDGLDRSYQSHYHAYTRIFTRCGLDYLAVDADPGNIGGSETREFMLLAESGEDTVLQCDACGYAANAERAEVGGEFETRRRGDAEREAKASQSEIVATPGMHTVAQVCDFLKVSPAQLIKTMIVLADGQPIAALVRGDRDLNLGKLGRSVSAACVALADAPTVERITGAPVGFAGPVGLDGVRIIADKELRGSKAMVVGANQNDAHRTNVAPNVDFLVSDWADIRVATEGDSCAQAGCSGSYRDARGIEVGHIFKLGTKYSRTMRAQVQMESGENRDILMGCYGLGVSRTMAAAVESRHDENGILWPVTIAPFEVVVVLVNPKDEAQRAAATQVYEALMARGVEVLFDDREERSGVKFKDADLIGYPIRIVVGRSVTEGSIEVGLRRDKAATQLIALDASADYVTNLIAAERERIG